MDVGVSNWVSLCLDIRHCPVPDRDHCCTLTCQAHTSFLKFDTPVFCCICLWFMPHRFCEAMIKIRGEIAEIEAGRMPKDNNPLVNAPHPASVVLAEQWDRWVGLLGFSTLRLV